MKRLQKGQKNTSIQAVNFIFLPNNITSCVPEI